MLRSTPLFLLSAWHLYFPAFLLNGHSLAYPPLQVPVKYMSAFSASKYALAGFTEAVRAEVAPLGVHIGQVHPGLVKSNFMERAEFYGKDNAEERKSIRQLVRD